MKTPDIPKSGKCGQTVWQGGPHGQFSHALVIPANPCTPAQRAVREIWGAVYKRWRKLTQAQRDCWIAAAEKKKTKLHLGQNGKLTGCQLFGKINVALAYFGRDQVDLPPKHPRFPKRAVSSLSVTNVANVIKISLGCPNEPGNYTILRASLPLERAPHCLHRLPRHRLLPAPRPRFRRHHGPLHRQVPCSACRLQVVPPSQPDH